MTIALAYPVAPSWPVSQTYAEHVARNLPNYFGGIDWACPTGTPVKAAADGVVTRCGEDGTGYGTHVRIQHDGGYLTIYAHLGRYGVKVGQTVHAGDVIGYSDNTGNSTGPHLHFELRKDGKAIDPAPLFMAVEVPEPEDDFDTAIIQPGWNLRDKPGVNTLVYAMTQAPMPVDVLTRQGDWVEVGVTLWVHQDALTG